MTANVEAQRQVVVKDVIYQFLATMLALFTCFLDVLTNSILQDYTYLSIFAIDCILVMTANFLGFRESRQYLKRFFVNFDAFIATMIPTSGSKQLNIINDGSSNVKSVTQDEAYSSQGSEPMSGSNDRPVSEF